jgi:hypothetical protein
MYMGHGTNDKGRTMINARGMMAAMDKNNAAANDKLPAMATLLRTAYANALRQARNQRSKRKVAA